MCACQESAGGVRDNVLSKFRMQESVKRGVQRSNGWSGEAVIQEVAEVRCGGPDRLESAVRRGAVRLLKRGHSSAYMCARACVLIITLAGPHRSVYSWDSNLVVSGSLNACVCA